MSILNPELAQLSSTAIVAVIALWAIVQLFREKKKNGNGKNGEIIKKLNNWEDNHFGTIDSKLDNLTNQGIRQEEKLNDMIRILTEINTKINNRKNGG